jgi:REP element-mobilizing transposase RayT
MPRHRRNRSKSGYYHVMVRGNERKNIFLDEQDKSRFVEILHEKKQGGSFYLQAFCLMDNHVHLMISEGVDDIARVMKRITVSYVYYFNKKYKRIGHLFQDRFRSEVVEDDNYVLSLVRYIHQNPVKAGIVNQMKEFKWSSYLSYIDEKNYFRKVVDTETVLNIFSPNTALSIQLYKKFMIEESRECFLDIKEEVMDEEEAKKLFELILLNRGIDIKQGEKIIIPEDIIKEFKKKTGLSIRKIAAITNINKDKVNKILNSE